MSMILLLLLIGASSGAYAAWDVTLTPPALVTPTTLFLPDNATVEHLTKFGTYVCTGDRYVLTLNNSLDYIIRMKPGASALTLPVAVSGGRNVRMVGIAIDLAVQTGCEVGLHSQPSNAPGGVNVHPLSSQGAALFLIQANVSYIEGMHLKMNGIEADAVSGRNIAGQSVDTSLAQRDYVFQNSRIEGWEGSNELHGDEFQQQTGVTRALKYENVTALGSYNGVIQEPNNSTYIYGLKTFFARNSQYIWDPSLDGDDPYDNAIGPVANVAVEGAQQNSLANISLSNLYSNTPGGATFYVQWTGGQRSYSPAQLPGFFSGNPAGGDYALASKVGFNYCSPHDGGACATCP